jgi:hypothetical protein
VLIPIEFGDHLELPEIGLDSDERVYDVPHAAASAALRWGAAQRLADVARDRHASRPRLHDDPVPLIVCRAYLRANLSGFSILRHRRTFL